MLVNKSNRCLRWPWFIGIIFFIFILMLAWLPDGCHDETNMYYSGCHTARFYGVTCTPNVDCWDHWPHDHSPGTNGSYFGLIIFILFFGSIFCIFFIEDDGIMYETHDHVARPRNFNYVKDPIINKHYYEPTINKHIYKKIEPVDLDRLGYPMS